MNTTLKLLEMNVQDAKTEAGKLQDIYSIMRDLTEMDYEEEWTDADYKKVEQHFVYMKLTVLMMELNLCKRRSYRLQSELRSVVADGLSLGCNIY